MSDNNPAARITIDPPIEWNDIVDSKLELRTIELVFNRHRQRGEQKPAARAIAPAGSDVNYYPHFIADQIQSVVDEYPGHDFGGFIEVRNSSPRQPAVARYSVSPDRKVVRTDAVLMWPTEQPEFECEVCTKPITSYPCVLCEHEPDPWKKPAEQPHDDGDVRIAQLESERARYRIAWRMARQRAKVAGWAADKYAKRSHDLHEAAMDLIGENLELKFFGPEAVAAADAAPQQPERRLCSCGCHPGGDCSACSEWHAGGGSQQPARDTADGGAE